MKTRIIPVLIIIIFFLIFFIFYLALKKSNIYTPDSLIEKDVPIFSVKVFDSDNEIQSSKIFSNDQFYLLNIWASWCLPCRDEHKYLIDLNDQKNLQIIGLNYKDGIEQAKEFLNELGNPYDIILRDFKGTIAIQWGAYGVPESFLIKDKKIIKKIIGPLSKDSLFEIKKIIK